MLFEYIGPLYKLLFMKKRAKNYLNAYYAVMTELNGPWTIMCVIHISQS